MSDYGPKAKFHFKESFSELDYFTLQQHTALTTN